MRTLLDRQASGSSEALKCIGLADLACLTAGAEAGLQYLEKTGNILSVLKFLSGPLATIFSIVTKPLSTGAEAGLVDNCPAPPCEGRCQRRWAVRASFRGNELAIEEWRFTGSVQLPEKARSKGWACVELLCPALSEISRRPPVVAVKAWQTSHRSTTVLATMAGATIDWTHPGAMGAFDWTHPGIQGVDHGQHPPEQSTIIECGKAAALPEEPKQLAWQPQKGCQAKAMMLNNCVWRSW
ncbi:TPA: hypothetical protein ACH3X3_011154 [Trebouxia sp. C0006]